MALVMLPSELPWWTVVVRKLTAIEATNDLDKILEIMQKIHDLCNISLDPEEDHLDGTVFDGLKTFVLEDMDKTERDNFLNHTIKVLCRFAKNLKQNRPPRGMNFSLQQNSDSVEFDGQFVASLMANSFFSTYPKRTQKTHPTLLDFNFTHFFNELTTNIQKAKLRSFLWYFDWLGQQCPEDLERKIKVSRKVMSGKQWLTIEDWMECKVPLCPMDVKHDSRLENASVSVTQTVFSHSAIGLKVLLDGSNQESVQLITHPELLISLLFVEKLEDNEALLVENVIQICRIVDPKNKAILEKLEKPKLKSALLCMDAENYKTYPPSQFEEDNCLRELNKCLLAFRQNSTAPLSSKLLKIMNSHSLSSSRDHKGRLSPIGESFSMSAKTSVDCPTKIIIEPTSPATSLNTTYSSLINSESGIDKRRVWLNLPGNKKTPSQCSDTSDELQKRRGRFIVLGSSGECLPVNRQSSLIVNNKANNFFANGDDITDDEDDIFYSARNSINQEEPDSDDSRDGECFNHQRYSIELETPENRFRFAQQLKDALKLENGYTESTDDCSQRDDDFDDGYAVDINVTGSRIDDKNIKIRRGTSTGFILEDEMSLEDCEVLPRLNSEMKRSKMMKRNKTGDSSKYSFDTESSELEEIYDQMAKWLNDPLDNKERKLDSRDKAVLKFADSLLKRALSESFLGEPIEEAGLEEIADADDTALTAQQKRKMVANFRSLSMEVAKHKHMLAAQLKKCSDGPESLTSLVECKLTERDGKVPRKWSITTKMEENVNCDVTIKLTQKNTHPVSNVRSVATGNWGCGEKSMGDPQLKLIIQWLAASVANVPVLVYYTCSHESLSKLDTVVRVLQDRKWTVGDLLSNALFYAKNILNNNPGNCNKKFCFFDSLIGLEFFGADKSN